MTLAPVLGMAEAIAAFDWAQTPLGPREEWPATLRLMDGIALNSRFPMLVFWGPELIQTYNDAFVPILGQRHPTALGQPARECWPEIWETIGPMLQGAYGGTPVWFEDLPLVLERNGYPEQTYFTFSYSRIGEEGEEGGVLCTCVETTKSVAREKSEREALEAFQIAALPKRLPVVQGVRFDAIYEAAKHAYLVGGDWYDVFALPDGRVAISVGDVTGNGLEAAVTMAGVRQALRGAALTLADPCSVLDAADRALRAEYPGTIVSTFFGVLDPPQRSFVYASAGHPPPMVRRPDGTIYELEETGIPLGLRREPSTRSATAVFEKGSLLVLYTDGLTEATRNLIEGERRLRDVLSREYTLHAADCAAAIRGAMLTKTTDDVAILTVKFDR